MRTLILAAAAAALIAGPALAAKKAEKPAPTNATATSTSAKKEMSPAQQKNIQTMKDCGAQWRALPPAQQQKYKDLAKTEKTKKGKPLNNGWIAFEKECRAKKG